MKKKILVNDKVKVIAGKDRDKVGTVKRVDTKKGNVVVENVNKVKRHTRGNPHAGQQGGIQDIEAPLNMSNVAIVCTSCTKATRVGYHITDDGKKLRFCKKCHEYID
jgi:large subunit ribosomal protein L24